jgi:hypothetical protein
MEEVWIKYYDTNYCVSNLGNVKSYYPTTKNWRNRKPQISNRGYLRTSFNLDKKYIKKSIHRLVAELFIPNPNDLPQVNHKNGIKTDNRVENLEWITISDNIKHSYSELDRIRKGAKGELSGKSKLTDEIVNYVRMNHIPYSRQFSLEKMAKQFNVNPSTLHSVIHNKTWI